MRSRSGRLSFWIKPAIAAGLVALADGFFWRHGAGSNIGVFALTLVIAVLAAHPAVRRDRRAGAAAAVAAVFALALFDAPGLLGLAGWSTALAVAVLSPRAGPGLDAVAWARRLIRLGLAGLIGPALDLWRARRRIGVPRGGAQRLMATIATPVIGGLLFFLLFTAANPVISRYLAALSPPRLDLARGVFWLLCLTGVWAFLRPRFSRASPRPATAPDAAPVLGISVASLGLSLVVFNALFALQNGLDIAFLWSGAALPKGMTFAQYAHRGAYALILTALLAGGFVLVALRPGSPAARLPWLRGLVLLWVAQTLLLVASSALRTFNYIEAYSLTRLRIAALLWMGLVAAGLVLITWRLVRGKTSAWLINANALAAAMVLAGCAVVDLDAVAAAWNVDHAREIGGDGPPLDLCYLSRLDDAAIVVPLSELERRSLAPPFRDRVSWVRGVALGTLEERQADWSRWTWRTQRRLARARAILPAEPAIDTISREDRNCDGVPWPTREPAAAPAAPAPPLTRAPAG